MLSTIPPIARNSIVRLLSHLQDPLHRTGYALTISAGMSSLVGFAFWVIAARLYTAEVVGANSAAISAMTFLSGLAGFYLDGTLIRFVPLAGQATGRLVGYTYIIVTIFAALVSSVFLMGLNLWSPGLAFLNGTLWSTIGFVVATMVYNIFLMQDAVLTGLRQAVWVPIENTTYALGKLILLVAFAAIIPASGVLASWAIPTIVWVVPITFLIFRYLVPRQIHATAKTAMPVVPAQIAKYAGTNYVGVLFAMAYTVLLPIMVLNVAGERASAYFYMPWVIAGFMRVLATSMSTSLTVEGAIDHTRLVQYFRHSLTSTSRLIIPLVVIVFVAAPYILSVFGNAYAEEGVWLLRLLALSTLPNIIVMLYLGLVRVQNRIGVVILVHMFIAVTTLGLSYLWLRSFGVLGVGLAWLASQTAVAIFLLITQLRPILKRGYTEFDTMKME